MIDINGYMLAIISFLSLSAFASFGAVLLVSQIKRIFNNGRSY